MSEDHKQIIVRWIDEMNKGRGPALKMIEELASPKYVCHDPTMGEIKGLDGLRTMVNQFYEAFPDLWLKLEDVFSVNDRVGYRVRFGGTHRGEFMGVAPTKKHVTCDYMALSRIEKGKILEEWQLWSTYEFMLQVGAIEVHKAVMTL